MTLRIGIVGAGHMGSHHAQKVAELCREDPELRLVGVTDVLVERADAAAAATGCLVTSDHRDLLPKLDAVIVAVPTIEHFGVVRNALEAGLDVLVEKPIAATVEEAKSLLALSIRGKRILQVGHLEWFNNAMRVIVERIRNPRFVEVHRLGPFPERSTDVDVVRDLMIHDLEILQQVIGDEPERVEAVGIPVLSKSVDIANARITYPGGCVANLTASRVSTTPMRKLRFFQKDGYFSIDFLEQSAVVIRREEGGEGEPPQIHVEKVDVQPADALEGQLRAFVKAVRTRESPAVDGAGGLGALRTAHRVIDAMPAIDTFE